MQQNSDDRMLTETKIKAIKSVRYARKYTDSGGLYLLVTPKGGRSWQYAYRFAKKYRKLSLGACPVVTLAWARVRHEFARHLLAQGIDPAALKSESREAFVAMMREWESASEPCGCFFARYVIKAKDP
jgi:Arm DNA-binding domain